MQRQVVRRTTYDTLDGTMGVVEMVRSGDQEKTSKSRGCASCTDFDRSHQTPKNVPSRSRRILFRSVFGLEYLYFPRVAPRSPSLLPPRLRCFDDATPFETQRRGGVRPGLCCPSSQAVCHVPRHRARPSLPCWGALLAVPAVIKCGI